MNLSLGLCLLAGTDAQRFRIERVIGLFDEVVGVRNVCHGDAPCRLMRERSMRGTAMGAEPHHAVGQPVNRNFPVADCLPSRAGEVAAQEAVIALGPPTGARRVIRVGYLRFELTKVQVSEASFSALKCDAAL
jgi:hypothetical protein